MPYILTGLHLNLKELQVFLIYILKDRIFKVLRYSLLILLNIKLISATHCYAPWHKLKYILGRHASF